MQLRARGWYDPAVGPARPDRRVWRVIGGGLAAALLVLVLGALLERVRYGPTDATALRRIAAEVQNEFTRIAWRVQRGASPEGLDPALIRQANTAAPAASRLFDFAAARVSAGTGLDALTLFDATGQPVAWAGRPSALPQERINGPEALFIAPAPQGLRLVAVQPVVQDGVAGRAGAVAAEHIFTPGAVRPGDTGPFTFPSSLAPVTLRPRYEGGGESLPPYGFLLTTPDGATLLEAEVNPAALRRLRHEWRVRVQGLALGVGALTLLLLAGLARERQELTRDRQRFVRFAILVAVLLVGARAVTAVAVPPGWYLHDDTTGLWLLRSAVDAIATPLLLLGLVMLAGDAVERRRRARRGDVPPPPGGRLTFWIVQVVAGALVGLVLLAQERLLHAMTAVSGGLEFSLHPFVVARLSIAVGAVLLNAAAVWAGVVTLRAAATTWRIRRSATGLRVGLGTVYAAAATAVIVAAAPFRPLDLVWPMAPAIAAVVLLTGVMRWAMPRYRHASQALRLTTAYLALVLPSVALYPLLVALSNSAVEQTIANEFAPEALTHRNELREQLRRSLDQLDEIAARTEHFGMQASAAALAPDADRAYFLWSQTELGRQRLTSSVELYATDGTLVSRFTLNLPAEFLATERTVDADCRWDVFGEALAATDDQVLLHAGRAICAPDGAGGQERLGAIVVHVVLDYGTLSFVAERDPATKLLRTGAVPDPAHGRQVDFAVYGWGRTPVYPTAGTAWPISGDLLRRIYRSNRASFWETLRRGGREYRVLLSNDRAGIYAIGYPKLRVVDHAVALAELLTIAGAMFVLLLGGLGAAARLSGRAPTTGRGLLREVRQSFYRKLFLLFVAASVVPVLALAFVTRAYVAGQLREGLESSALRTASAARRVIETVVSQRRGPGSLSVITDEVLVSVSRIIDQDVNVFVGPSLVATSQRDLFASGLLPTRTPADAARAINLERQSSYVGDEQVGLLEYTVVAVPVRDGDGGAIVTVPLTLRQQEIEREIDDLDRRVALAAVVFILLGAAIGYFTAERIADPVNRLTRATRRIARGDFDARIHVSSTDELRRLVEAFNQMAADLQRQRAELERTHRLAAWAEMARQVAHDIKNPLTPIQLSSEHLRRVHVDKGLPLGSVVDECVDAILSQVALLRQIASEFSSFASSPVARLAPTRLEEVVAEVVAPYEVGLPDAISLEVTHGGPLPLLHVDRTLLARALVNVIENALHAMRGGGTLSIRTAPTDEGGALIEVADTGVGMDDEALSRLFEPYFSTKATGTGLGLTIARRNVELNSGTIAVVSAKGRGTTVTLRLPPPPDAGGPA